MLSMKWSCPLVCMIVLSFVQQANAQQYMSLEYFDYNNCDSESDLFGIEVVLNQCFRQVGAQGNGSAMVLCSNSNGLQIAEYAGSLDCSTPSSLFALSLCSNTHSLCFTLVLCSALPCPVLPCPALPVPNLWKWPLMSLKSFISKNILRTPSHDHNQEVSWQNAVWKVSTTTAHFN